MAAPSPPRPREEACLQWTWPLRRSREALLHRSVVPWSRADSGELRPGPREPARGGHGTRKHPGHRHRPGVGAHRAADWVPALIPDPAFLSLEHSHPRYHGPATGKARALPGRCYTHRDADGGPERDTACLDHAGNTSVPPAPSPPHTYGAAHLVPAPGTLSRCLLSNSYAPKPMNHHSGIPGGGGGLGWRRPHSCGSAHPAPRCGSQTQQHPFRHPLFLAADSAVPQGELPTPEPSPPPPSPSGLPGGAPRPDPEAGWRRQQQGPGTGTSLRP